MDIQEIRRANLRAWVESHSVPQKEKSYFSQLTGSIASFGERAARRIEADYGMDAMSLDRPVTVSGVVAEDSDLDLLVEICLLFKQSTSEARRRIASFARLADKVPTALRSHGDGNE